MWPTQLYKAMTRWPRPRTARKTQDKLSSLTDESWRHILTS